MRRLLRTALRWSLRLVLVFVALVVVMMGVWRVLPPVSTLMVARWSTGEPVERLWVPLDAISPRLRASVIMSEDGQFCRHHGVDWHALGDVIDSEDGPSRGASTITMQVVKNLFLWPSRSYIRKAIEIPMALVLDAVWPKRRILEVYLNIAEWGDGIFGAEAAARHYFHKPASALTLHQAALLATALPNPRLRNPARPTRRHGVLARIIVGRVLKARTNAACVLGGRG